LFRKENFTIKSGPDYLSKEKRTNNAAYHIAGKYSSIISPFFFTQIIWATLYGKVFFSEQLDTIAVIGIAVIVISGTVAFYNRNK
jgi:hypothetical protein